MRLVNETPHVRRRAFYAASAKWGCRPNEMLALDRYASLGLPTPSGLPKPHGFENGFPAHPEIKPFHMGGQLVYLPEKRDAQGNPLKDKRTGNRWLVVDAELRPILEQALADRDRSVKRDPKTGLPVGTGLWLNGHGIPEANTQKGSAPSEISQRWFYPECERLGLMRAPDPKTGFKGDRADPQRAWTAHCQRHLFEQIGQKANVPGDWMNHFRGDAFTAERGSCYKPRPEDVLAKYLALMPRLGLKPLAEAPRLAGGMARSEAEMHAQILKAEAAAVQGRRPRELACVSLEGCGAHRVVPQRLAASCLHAARKAHGEGVSVWMTDSGGIKMGPP